MQTRQRSSPPHDSLLFTTPLSCSFERFHRRSLAFTVIASAWNGEEEEKDQYSTEVPPPVQYSTVLYNSGERSTNVNNREPGCANHDSRHVRVPAPASEGISWPSRRPLEGFFRDGEVGRTGRITGLPDLMMAG